MLVANLGAIRKATKRHAAVRRPMADWLEVAELAEWGSIIDARKTFPTADFIKKTPYTCFNVGGNIFRLIVTISYVRQ